MMQLKYMNSCARQLFLLSVSNLLLITMLIFPLNVSAEWIESEGRYYIDRKTSRDEACKNALIDARRKALAKAKLEIISSQQIDVCNETKNNASCSLFQSTFAFIDGGFITEIKKEPEKIVDSTPEKECVIKIQANVIKYDEKPDVNFVLKAKLNNKPKVYEGAKISLDAEITQNSYISVLGWYPGLNSENYYRIFPIENEKNKIDKGLFSIPRKKSLSKYELIANFPKNSDKKDAHEFLVILATKDKFDIISEENISDFYKRLNRLGRSRWETKILGYTIINE